MKKFDFDNKPLEVFDNGQFVGSFKGLKNLYEGLISLGYNPQAKDYSVVIKNGNQVYTKISNGTQTFWPNLESN